MVSARNLFINKKSFLYKKCLGNSSSAQFREHEQDLAQLEIPAQNRSFDYYIF